MTEIISSNSLLSVWEFLSSSQLKEVVVVRFIMATLFIILQFPILTASGPLVTDLLSSGGEKLLP